MSKLVWDKDGERRYETGVSQGVLYLKDSTGKYNNGVAWNGLTNVSESPSGAENTALWADNMKYLNLKSAEEFGATIECYTYPPEFDSCNGVSTLSKGIKIGQQARQSFGFCYKTILGNDTEGEVYGYKLHLLYGCDASPSEASYGTVNDNPDAITFSYEISTTPVTVTNHKPTSLVIIDSTETDADILKAIEDILYGTDEDEPRLPMPDELLSLGTGG